MTEFPWRWAKWSSRADRARAWHRRTWPQWVWPGPTGLCFPSTEAGLGTLRWRWTLFLSPHGQLQRDGIMSRKFGECNICDVWSPGSISYLGNVLRVYYLCSPWTPAWRWSIVAAGELWGLFFFPLSSHQLSTDVRFFVPSGPDTVFRSSLLF